MGHLLIAVIAFACGVGAANIARHEDGFVEEVCEEIIFDELGMVVDITPESQELDV